MEHFITCHGTLYEYLQVQCFSENDQHGVRKTKSTTQKWMV